MTSFLLYTKIEIDAIVKFSTIFPFSEVSDDEDEDNEQIHDSIMELYKNRHKNPEALQQWQQIEEELFKKNKDLVQIMKNEIVENVNNVDDPEKKQQALFDLDNIQANNEHLPLKNVRLMRHPSSDEGCYTSSSNTCSSSSSGKNKNFLHFLPIYGHYFQKVELSQSWVS